MANWGREKVKNSNSVRSEDVKSLNVFITGGVGAGKSRLIETGYAFLTKTFNLMQAVQKR